MLQHVVVTNNNALAAKGGSMRPAGERKPVRYSAAIEFTGLRGIIIAHKYPGALQMLIHDLETIALSNLSREERSDLVSRTHANFKSIVQRG